MNNTITMSNDIELLKNTLKGTGDVTQMLVKRKGKVTYTAVFAEQYEHRGDEMYNFLTRDDCYAIQDIEEWCILID